MAFVIKDRVRESTTTSGTGAITLLGAAVGFQTFSSAIGNANNTFYVIADQAGTNFEGGIGTYTSSTNTLSRDTVLFSSNAGALVTFGTNTKDVWVDYPAARAAYLNSIGAIDLTMGGTGKITATEGLANLFGFTTTATAAGSTTLTSTSSYNQVFTGTTTQTIVLPVTTTLTQGWSVLITNSSTGNLTVNSSGGNLVATVLPNTSALVMCILNSGTTATSWEAGLTNLQSASSTQNGYLNSTDWNTFNNKSNQPINTITALVASNALTCGIGATTLQFINPTLTNGTPNTISVGALSITVPSTATLGTIAATAAKLTLLVAYNGGTPVLCIANMNGAYNFDESSLISPTTISTGATSAGVIYSASAVSANSPYRVVGYITITEATAGTWATAPTIISGYENSMIVSGATNSLNANCANYLAGNTIGAYICTNYTVTPNSLGYTGTWNHYNTTSSSGQNTLYGWIRTA